MRALNLALFAALATILPSVAVVGAAQAKPHQPRAELVAKAVTGLVINGQVTVGARVKNKGTKKATASQAAFYLSTDGTRSATDTALGTVKVAKIKPKKSKPAAGTFALPTALPSGTYRVLACADSGNQVKEPKETNNCKASKGSITVTAVRVTATAGTGGTVATSGVTGATCAGTVCTFPTPGAGTVTFTPTPSAGYRFGAWTGSTCTGQTAGAGNAITFTRPTTSKTCTASFVRQVTISWTVATPLTGTVAGIATNGTCEASNPLTGAGSCLVDAGVGTVTLTATAVLPFTGWSGATCDGVKSGTGDVVMTFTAPSADKACTATFTI